ncbi:hypothetical protein JQ586_38670 [Bradyrhizobium jicamae]|nr:hypothetical protein [Bradyrhizobium jicamae]
MKAKWADPVFRAKMSERDSRSQELRKANPARFTRTGIPNGMRREEAERMWSVADAQADKIIQHLKADGVLPATPPGRSETAVASTVASTAAANIPVPDTDAGMAEAALREVFKLALGPTGTRVKLAALATIMKFTRLKPIDVLKLATGTTAEAVLDELAASE